MRVWEIERSSEGEGRLDVVYPEVHYDLTAQEALDILREEVEEGDEIIFLALHLRNDDIDDLLYDLAGTMASELGEPVH